VPRALHIVDTGHWRKAASEAIAHTRDLFAFVDVPACLSQDKCHEVLAIRPD